MITKYAEVKQEGWLLIVDQSHEKQDNTGAVERWSCNALLTRGDKRDEERSLEGGTAWWHEFFQNKCGFNLKPKVKTAVLIENLNVEVSFDLDQIPMAPSVGVCPLSVRLSPALAVR